MWRHLAWRSCPARAGAGLALSIVLAAMMACTPRAPSPPAPATVPGPGTPAPDARHVPPGPLPPPRPTPAPPAPDVELSDRERGAVLFTHWRSSHSAQVDAFEEFLVREQVAQVVPTYQLLRSASMWKECRAEPFEVPPRQVWPQVREVLVLLRELREQEVLPAFEVVSAYRDPALNRCAGGAPGSSHQVFAVDIAPVAAAEGARLCRFWREHGHAWQMGVSRYPSGRIHVDRSGFRTWGASHQRGSSNCLGADPR